MHALFIFTLFFTAGVALQALHIPPIMTCLGFFLVFIFAYTKLTHHIPLQQFFIACIAFSCGALRFAQRETLFATQAQQLCNKKISIYGEIIEIDSSNPYKTTITVATPQGTVLVASSTPIHCYTGDTVTLPDMYVMVPDNASYRNYLKKRGVVGTARISDQQRFIVHANCNPLWQACQKNKSITLSNIKEKLSAQTWSLVGPLFFGMKNTHESDDFEIRTQFQSWGLSHYLARSGLHLIIFIIILELMGSLFPLSLLFKHMFVACCIAVYAAFSFSSISFTRALCMVALYSLCSLRTVQYHALYALTLIFCCILLHNPYQLFFS